MDNPDVAQLSNLFFEAAETERALPPAIRKQISSIVRQHIEDIVVMGFTELPDNRKINIIASIGEDIEKE